VPRYESTNTWNGHRQQLHVDIRLGSSQWDTHASVELRSSDTWHSHVETQLDPCRCQAMKHWHMTQTWTPNTHTYTPVWDQITGTPLRCEVLIHIWTPNNHTLNQSKIIKPLGTLASAKLWNIDTDTKHLHIEVRW
jgi:hypothetical protein